MNTVQVTLTMVIGRRINFGAKAPTHGNPDKNALEHELITNCMERELVMIKKG